MLELHRVVEPPAPGHMRKTLCMVLGSHPAAKMGGSQYQAQCLIEALNTTGGFDIVYLARNVDPGYEPVDHAIRRIGNDRSRHSAYVFDTVSLYRLLRKIEPDVIYQRGLKSYTGVVAYYAKRARCQSVFHAGSDSHVASAPPVKWSALHPVSLLDRQMKKYGLRNIRNVVAQTNLQAELLYRNYGRRAAAVVPNFHPLPKEAIHKESTPVRVLWIGNLRAVKRPGLFVDLARELAKESEIRFIMIGRPGDKPRIKRLIEEMGDLDNLSYLGELSMDGVNQELAKGHLLVNTSDREGFPNTFIQAWMRRVPTVSLNVDPDGVLEREGLGVCTGSYERLKEAILTLARDHRRRELMGENAERYAVKSYSLRAAGPLLDILAQEP